MRPTPSRDQLVRYVLGKSTAQEQNQIENCIKTNPRLLDELDDINLENGDSLVRSLRNWFSDRRNQSSLAKPISGTRPAFSSDLINADFGNYRIAALISNKGANTVFEAIETRSGRVVAIKLLRPCFSQDAKRVPNSSKELHLVGKFNHPNLVRIIDSGEYNGIDFVVMERLEGFDVGKILLRTGPLSIPDACSILWQTANALQYASENSFVHRDVKPSNIFLTTQGVVKLLDLGLIRDLSEESTETLSGQLLGTIDYMAPEQAFDTHCVDIRSDIYSLGCTFFKLLTGEAPFSGSEYQHLLRKALAHASHQIPPIQELRPDVPEELVDILQRMCAKNPNDRFSSPKDVSIAVEAFCVENTLLNLLDRLEDADKENQAADASYQSRSVENSGDREGPTGRSTRDSNWLLRPLVFSCCLIIGTLLCVFAASVGASRKRPIETDAPFRRIGNVFKSLDRYFVEGIQPQSLELSPDGRLVALVGVDGTLRVVSRETNETAFEVNVATTSISKVSFSSDSRYLLACGRDRRLTVWNTAGFFEAFAFQIPMGTITVADFSHSGDSIVAADSNGLLHTWDLQSGRRNDYPSFERVAPIESLSLLPDNRRVFTGCREGECRLYDTKNGEFIRLFNGHSSVVHSVAVSVDSELGLSGSEDQSVRLWNLSNGKEVAVFHGHEKPVTAVSFTSDPDVILSADWGGRICFWNIRKFRLVEIVENEPGILSPKMINSGELATLDTSNMYLTTWDLSSLGNRSSKSTHGNRHAAKKLFPVDLEEAIVTKSPPSITVADHLFRAESPSFAVQCLTVSEDGKYLFSGHRNGIIRAWNIETKKPIADFSDQKGFGQTIHSIAFHSKTGSLIGVGAPTSVKLWAFDLPVIASNLTGHSDRVWSVAITRDGSQAVTGSWDGSVKVWDLTSQELLRSFQLNDGKVFAVGYLPDESSIMVSGRGFVSRLDSKTGEEQWTFFGHPHFIHAMSISSDGEKIAFGGRDNSLRILNAKNGEQVHVMRGHSQWINDVAFSADSSRIITASADNTVRVWNCEKSSQCAILEGHKGPVLSAKFLNGLENAVTCGTDGNICLWLLDRPE